MESATLRRVPPLSSAVQLGLVFGLVLLAAVAWAMTGDRMGGMDAGPGTDLGGARLLGHGLGGDDGGDDVPFDRADGGDAGAYRGGKAAGG